MLILWEKFRFRQGDYSLCYPDTLITSLANHVRRTCESLGLRKVIDDNASDEPFLLSTLINEAWKKFFDDASAYPTWEQEQVTRVRAIIGRLGSERR